MFAVAACTAEDSTVRRYAHEQLQGMRVTLCRLYRLWDAALRAALHKHERSNDQQQQQLRGQLSNNVTS